MRAFTVTFVWFAFVSLTAEAAVTSFGQKSLLMVGNSFTEANGLEEMIQKMLEGVFSQGVYAMRFKRGSSRFAEYANNTHLQSMVAERPWTWVVLQEQSEIPAFGGSHWGPTLDLSIRSVKTLNDWIQKDRAETVVMMTWARRTVDEYYPDLFPDFETMQSKLVKGYDRIQDAISTHERPVRLAPAGLAFEKIRRDNLNSLNGKDPGTVSDSLFYKLYSDDGVHPSLLGSYLVACVIFFVLVPERETITWTPGEMDDSVRWKLQQAALATVQQFNQDNVINREWAALNEKTDSKDSKRPYQSTDSLSDSDARPTWMILLVVVVVVAAVSMKLRRKTPATQTQHVQYTGLTTTDVELVDLPS